MELGLYLIASAVVFHGLVHAADSLRIHFADKRKDDMLGSMVDAQQQMQGSMSYNSRTYRAIFEHETGRKVEEMSDADIISLVRSNDEGTEDAG